MQDLKKDPELLELIALAEERNLPRTAAACEHFIVKSSERKPPIDLQSISKAACMRIIRALSMRLTAAIDEMQYAVETRFRDEGRGIPSVDTMLAWR